jgi:hypothetical protein
MAAALVPAAAHQGGKEALASRRDVEYDRRGWGPRGERRSADQVKRDGWRELGVLAISLDDERLTSPERELVRCSASGSTAGVRRASMGEWTPTWSGSGLFI